MNENVSNFHPGSGIGPRLSANLRRKPSCKLCVRASEMRNYFKLNPDYDAYERGPKNWRDFMGVHWPPATILLMMAYDYASMVWKTSSSRPYGH